MKTTCVARRVWWGAGLLLVCLGCFGCRKKVDPHTLALGVVAGPDAELVQAAQTVAREVYGLEIKIIPFSDYTMPNMALAERTLDANMFQHAPYLQAAIAARGFPLVAVGKTFLFPVGIYSTKLKKLSDLKPLARVAIPNDPSNGGRALLLLQKAGLLTLDLAQGLRVTVLDVRENPKQLKIQELDAAQLPRVLQEVDLAVINTNYAVPAGLLPNRDALFLEGADSPYANLVVAREDNKDDPRLRQLVEVLHSERVKEAARRLFQGQAVPAWE